MIRALTPADYPAIVDIINHYIQHTAITFDTETYTVDSRQSWFQQFNNERHLCLVYEHDGKVVAYANSGQLKPKAAYDTSVEVSIYKHPEFTEAGVGSELYSHLLSVLSKADVNRAYAYITLPNSASLKIHEKFRFRSVGVLTEAGRKFGEFHDVAILEKQF